MKLKVFSIPFDPACGFDDNELESFCSVHEIVAMKEHWFEYQGAPWLTVLIQYHELAQIQRGARSQGNSKAKDPRRALDDEQKNIYDLLREWRSLRANSDGVPPYLVFNNRQLAEIARYRPAAKGELGEISGIGPGKIDRYAEDVLAVLSGVASPP